MARRAVWDPPAYAWFLAGVAGLAMAYKLYPAAFQGAKALATPLVALGEYSCCAGFGACRRP